MENLGNVSNTREKVGLIIDVAVLVAKGVKKVVTIFKNRKAKRLEARKAAEAKKAAVPAGDLKRDCITELPS